jgi:hypothetical protein
VAIGFPDLPGLGPAAGTPGPAPAPAPAWRLVLNGIPDFITAAMFWLAWSQPLRWGPHLVKDMEVALLLEFFVIHSSGFLAVFGRFRPVAAGLCLFYLLIVGVICLSTGSPWALAAFAWLLFSKLHLRLPGTAAAAQAAALRELIIDWPFSVAIYLVSLVLGLAVLDAPRLGISDAVFATAGLKDAGLFEDQPWKAMAAGLIYFSLIGLWRMHLWRLLRRTPAPVLP